MFLNDSLTPGFIAKGKKCYRLESGEIISPFVDNLFVAYNPEDNNSQEWQPTIDDIQRNDWRTL